MKIRHKRYALYIFVLASFMQKTRYQYFLENFSQDLLLFFFFLFSVSVPLIKAAAGLLKIPLQAIKQASAIISIIPAKAIPMGRKGRFRTL